MYLEIGKKTKLLVILLLVPRENKKGEFAGVISPLYEKKCA